MKEYNKKINYNTIVKINSNHINLTNLSNGIIQDLDFILTDDYGFSSYSENDTNEINFEIGLNNPLYVPFNVLLNGEDKLIINSDLTREQYNDRKYIEISFNNKKINIKFADDLGDIQCSVDKFQYFIINRMHDMRSRYDANNTNMKERLNNFWRLVRKILTKDDYCVCANCDNCISDDLLEEIRQENSEYENMSLEEVAKEVGNCEFGYTSKEMYEMGMWCPCYISNEECLKEQKKKLVLGKKNNCKEWK